MKYFTFESEISMYTFANVTDLRVSLTPTASTGDMWLNFKKQVSVYIHIPLLCD